MFANLYAAHAHTYAMLLVVNIIVLHICQFWIRLPYACRVMDVLCLREWLVVVTALALTQRPCNSVPLSSFYPYGYSAGDSNLPANDDGYTSLITLSTSFPYFGQSYTGLYVSYYGDVV